MENKRTCSLRLLLTLTVAGLLLGSLVLLAATAVFAGGETIVQAVGFTSQDTEGVIPEDAMTFPAEGEEFQVMVDDQTSSHTARNLTGRFTAATLGAMGVIFLAGVGATYFLVGKILDPLGRLCRELETVQANRLEANLDISCGVTEVEALSRAFREMMERLDRGFRDQKNFAAQAAHELKTPLAAMKTSLQVLHLGEGATLEEYAANARVMEEANQRMIGTVENLLHLMKRQSVSLEEEIDTAALFRKIEQELSSLGQEKGIVLEKACRVAKFRGNRDLIYRCVVNLLENALKYTPEGGKVELSAFPVSEGVCIAVTDNGPGIPREEADRVFEPFYRGKHAPEAAGGSGLGLYLVKSIAREHGGRIDLLEVPGGGTCARLTLPQRDGT